MIVVSNKQRLIAKNESDARVNPANDDNLEDFKGHRVRRTGTGNSRYREFFIFLVVSEPVSEKFGTGKKYRKNLVPEKSIGTGIGKIWYRKKVSEPVSVKFGIGKKSRNRYRENLVPEKSLGTGIGKNWYRKKSWNWNKEYLVKKNI